MGKFVIFRSPDDEVAGKDILKGHEVDPDLGPHGGFILGPFWTEHPEIRDERTGRDGEPVNPKPVRREVVKMETYIPEAIPEDAVQEEWERTRYKVEPVELDAIYLAGLRPRWSYREIMTDGELEALREGRSGSPVMAEEASGGDGAPQAAAGSPPEQDEPEQLSEYRQLQNRCREICETNSDAPDVDEFNLKQKAKLLRAFIAEFGDEE